MKSSEIKYIYTFLFCCVSLLGYAQGCVDENQIDPTMICAKIWSPVCGCDAVTYSNECLAQFAGGVASWTEGECALVEDADGCADLAGIDFGECDMVLGIGRIDGYCTYVSGCGSFVDGVDYAVALYATVEDCVFSCNEGCVSQEFIDLGALIDCMPDVNPVCGCDNMPYQNVCHAMYVGGNVSWTDGPCLIIEELGCIYQGACNFNPNAFADDGSCVFPPFGCEFSSDTPDGGCTYPFSMNYNPEALWDDGTCMLGSNPCPADLNGDGVITAGDLLVFLASFGTTC